ncbi:MAG TPA: extracellular solute-binding protein [Bacteroidota bacterium]
MHRMIMFAAAGSVLLLAGCSRAPDRTAVVVYSPHGRELLAEFEQRFEAAHPTADVQWLDMGSQDIYDRLVTERTNPQADVWWGAPMTEFDRAAAAGLLEPYVPSWDTAAPAGEKSRDHYWYGTFLTPEVIMYNNRMVTEEDAPKDWDDLLAPQWQGRILIRYPLSSGTMRIIFCAIIQREALAKGDSMAGFRWLKRLDANTKSYVADPTQLYLRVAREEAPLSMWDMPDVQLQAEKSYQPFGYVVPSSGTPIITEGIAIVKGCPHPDLARAFYEFVTSKASMIDEANQFFRIPVRTDIARTSLPQWMAARDWKAMKVDWRSLAAHEATWMQYWDEHIKGTGRAAGGER